MLTVSFETQVDIEGLPEQTLRSPQNGQLKHQQRGSITAEDMQEV